MAKAYTFSTSGGLVPVSALDLSTSLNVASSAVVLDTDGITLGSNKDITLSGGGEVLGLPSTPSGATAAASMAYVQSYANSVASGLDIKVSVVAATTAELDAVYDNGASGVGATLTANSNGAIAVDGVTLSANGRVLVKDQTNGEENGIYVVTSTGDGSNPFVLTRATDADTGGASGKVTPGMFTFIEAGTTYADTGWVLSSPDTSVTMGTTELVFTQFSSTGAGPTAGAGLTLNGSAFDIVSTNTGISVGANDITLSLASQSGLAISSGLKLDISTLGVAAVIDVSSDTFPILHGGVTKYASLSQVATGFAGAGLGASSGVLAVNVDGSTIEISSDSLRIKADGITNSHINSAAAIAYSKLDLSNSIVAGDITSGAITSAKLATGAVSATKLETMSADTSLVSDASIANPEGKALYVKSSNGKLAVTANSQAGMHVAGICATTSVGSADVAIDLHTVAGTYLTIPSNARNGNFSAGSMVYADASGILTTDLGSDFSAGDWACPVGLAVTTGTMFLRIGLPFQL